MKYIDGRLRKYIVFFLILCQVLMIAPSLTGSVHAESGENPTVRIGILFGSDAVESYQTTSPEGFVFGAVYDSDNLTFKPFFNVACGKISVSQDENLAKNAAGRYYRSNSNIIIGKYHAEFAGEFKDFASAQKYIADLGGSYPNPFPAYANGKIYVRCGSFTSEREAKTYASSKGMGVAAVSNTAVTVINPAEDRILFEFDAADADFCVYATDKNGSAVVTNNSGIYDYPGNIVYRRSGSGIEIINLLPMQDYIKGVLPAEISPNWHEEALKAFSVVVRTYTVRLQTKHSSQGFMMCSGTHCQVYRGTSSATETSNKAVDATKGMIITYNGKPIEAVYHSSSGGITETHNDAWGGSLTHPYLVSVPLPFEDYTNPTHKRALWSFSVDKKTLTEYLKNSSSYKERFAALTGEVSKIVTTSRSQAGYIKSVDVYDNKGNKVTITNSDNVRIAFSRYAYSANMSIYAGFLHNVNNLESVGINTSDLYVITADGISQYSADNSSVQILSANGERTVKVDEDTFIFSGKGWGHGVGLSQYGMMDLAELGTKYKEIIQTFYTGVKIESLTALN